MTRPVSALSLRPSRDQSVAEEDTTGTVREYLYAGGEAPTAMRARQADGTYKNYFFVTNTHGDVVAVTDRDGTIVNRYAYGPWGEATRVSETVHQPFRYAGYFYEPTADLYWLRARWYDAGTGRFLSRDPLRGEMGELVSMNRYAYAHGNPSTLTDPGGLSPRAPSPPGLCGMCKSYFGCVLMEFVGLCLGLSVLTSALAYTKEIGHDIIELNPFSPFPAPPRDPSIQAYHHLAMELRVFAYAVDRIRCDYENARPTSAGVCNKIGDVGYWMSWIGSALAVVGLLDPTRASAVAGVASAKYGLALDHVTRRQCQF